MNSTALAVCAFALSGPASANDATVGGVSIPVGAGFNATPLAIWVPFPLLPTVVTVDTTDLNSGFNTVWVTGSVADTTVNISAGRTLTSTLGWGTAVSATTGNVVINNDGTINSLLHAIYTPTLTGNTTINSAGSLTATGLLQAGIYSNSTTGNILADGLGTGSITGAFNGVEMATASAVAGQGTITVQNFTGGITGGNDGISANFGAGSTLGDVLITNNGPITGTLRNGIETYTFGNTTITDNGDVTGAINGIAANFAWASPGNVLISGNGNATGGALGSGIVAGTGTGNIDILAGATSTGGTGIWAVSSLGGNVVVDGAGTGTATGTTVDGVRVDTFSVVAGQGLATVQNFTGGITGVNNGVTVNFGAGTTLGDVLVTNNGPITGTARNGIETYTFGNTTITDNGDVTGAINGIAANFNWASPGNVLISGNGNATGGALGSGIVAGTGAGNIDISAGATSTGGAGIWALSSLGGNVVVDGAGTGVATGTVNEGVLAQALGDATVTNFATVEGVRNGIWVTGPGLIPGVIGGTTSIQGNGLVGGVTGTGAGSGGIVVGASSGDINIGNVATNGVITGALHGIWANATAGAGAINITVDKNVTGTAGDGIFSGTLSGNQTINILAPAIVQGGLYGLATGTTTGVATTNNTGTIQNLGDGVGAASDPGLQAVWLGTGNNTVNNDAGGKIIGGFTTGGLDNTLNNNAGGTWTPSLANTFAGLNDTVNNAGLINVRSGDTVFLGLEAFNNLSGGRINMQYGPGTADVLTVLNFSPKAGSILDVNVAPGAANQAGDSGGQGQGDTIVVVGAATPAAKSTINVASLGATQTTLTGSIAIVNTAAADVLAPTPGARLAPSAFYMLGAQNLPDFGAKYVYTLVDDGAGGVFLVWQPNTGAAALGGFGGGVVGGDGSGSGANGAGALAAANGSSAGLGGAGGPPSGGGAVGRIGDIAADTARLTNAECSAQGRFNGRGWAEGSGSRTTGDVTSNSRSLAGGTEIQLPTDTCGRHAVGIFGFAGDAATNIGGASDKSENRGVGGYLRAATSFGLYGSVLGAYNWADHAVFNPVIGSTADRDETSKTIAGAVGLVTHLAPGTILDIRGIARYSTGKGDEFTDSVGITVSGTSDKSTHYGALVGVSQMLAPSLWLDLRAGVTRSEFDSSITAYGVTQSGSVSAVTRSVEAGLRGQLTSNIEIGASGFGAFTDDTNSYGARAHLGVKF